MQHSNLTFISALALGATIASSLLAAGVRPPDQEAAVDDSNGLSAAHASAPATQILSRGLRGVYFIPNQGQWADDSILYGFMSRGLDIAFRESSLTMHLRREIAGASGTRERPVPFEHTAPLGDASRSQYEPPQFERLTLDVTFPGSRRVAPTARKPQDARFNYYIGDDESAWRGDVPSYGTIVYESIYDGVDLHVTGSDGGVLKYEFHCAPGADHEPIRIRYDGMDSLRLDASGNLLIETTFGTLLDSAPIVWQEIDGRRCELPARFELLDPHTYTLALLTPHDPSHALILDPEVDWMRYLGNSWYDRLPGVAVDSGGNVLVTGRFHQFSGPGVVQVAKISPSGTLIWHTLTGGAGNDQGEGIAVDAAGSARVVGATDSVDFFGRRNSHHGGGDAFILHISSAGVVQWTRFLGGSRFDMARGVALDASGYAMVTGSTDSTDFEGRNNSYFGGFDDAFVARVSPDSTVQWMTYAGGSGFDGAAGVTVDSVGTAYVTGKTDSTNFNRRNNSRYGLECAYIFAVNLSGVTQWMTYAGGFTGGEWGTGIAIYGNDLYVAGGTNSTDFVGRNNSIHGVGEDGFLLKTNRSGVLSWMTYLGGSGRDLPIGVAADSDGHAIVVGTTNSRDFEGRTNTFYGGWFGDACALKVNADGALQWMTYLGGSGEDYGVGVAVGVGGNVYIAGHTDSTDFVGRLNDNSGREDGFIVRIRDVADPFSLSIEGISRCPGTITIRWRGAPVNTAMSVYFARNLGSQSVPFGRPCAGVRLDLGANGFRFVAQVNSGPNGSDTASGYAGSGACRGHLQLIEHSRCTTSNTAQLP